MSLIFRRIIPASILSILCCTSLLHAGSIQDSLWKEYYHAEQQQDKGNQCKHLCQIGKWIAGTLRSADLDSALVLMNQALTIAESTHDSSTIALVAINLGNLYDSRNETKASLNNLHRALRASISTQRDDLLSLVLCNIAKSFFRVGNFSESFSFALKSYALAQRCGDRTALALSAQELSRNYWAKQEFQKSDDLCKIALENAGGDPLLYSRGKYFSAIGVNAYHRGNHREAIRLWQQGIVAYEASQESVRARFLIINIAASYNILGEYEREDSTMAKGIEMDRAANDTLSLLENLFALMLRRNERGLKHEADSLMNVIFDLSIATNDSGFSHAKALHWQGCLARDRHENRKAYQLFLQARTMLDTSTTNNHRLILLDSILSNLANQAHSLGQWRDVSRWLTELKIIQDRHRFEADGVGLQEINDLHAIEQEQSDFDLLQIERRETTTKIIAGVIVVGLMLVVLTLLFLALRRRRRHSEQLGKYVQQLTGQQIELTERNRQNDRLLREREEFMAIAAHDIKNPLIGIRMTAYQLNQSIESTTVELQRRVATIVTATERILKVVNKLMAQSITVPELAPTISSSSKHDLANYTQMIADDFEDQASERGITVQLVSTLQEPIMLDATEPYHEILENFLSNAVKYAPENTTVTVRLQCTEGMTEAEVHDVGDTITEEASKTIFDQPNRNRHNDGISHGVGLFAAYRTAESNGWQLMCRVGDGTRFILIMPNSLSAIS